MKLRDIAMTNIVNSLKNAPESIQEEILEKTSLELEEIVVEKVIQDVTTILPELIIEITQDKYMKRFNKYSSRYSWIEEYILNMAIEIANSNISNIKKEVYLMQFEYDDSY